MIRLRTRGAFTLVELLAVLAIVALVLVLTVPAVNSSLRSLQLTQATQLLAEQIAAARQTALTRNRSVEVRLYSYADASSPAPAAFRALQTFLMNDDGTFTALDKVYRLPNAVIIDASANLSTLIGSAQTSPSIPTTSTGAALGVSIPQIGTQYNSVAFHFLPDGSMNLPTGGQAWFVTVHHENLGTSLTTLPLNFSTIQLDPYNGQLTVLRP